MSRTVEVPEGCKVVFVSDQLVQRYADWTPVFPGDIRATPVGDSDLIIDVQTRYTTIHRDQ